MFEIGQTVWLVVPDDENYDGLECVVATPLAGLEPSHPERLSDHTVFVVTVGASPRHGKPIALWAEPERLTTEPPTNNHPNGGRNPDD